MGSDQSSPVVNPAPVPNPTDTQVVRRARPYDPGEGEGNIYQLFGFDLYSCPAPHAVTSQYWHLARNVHPDRNGGPQEKLFYNGLMKTLNAARDEFERWEVDPERKQEYDDALRARLAANGQIKVSKAEKIARWTGIGALIAGGIVMTVCGLVLCAPSGGTAIGLSIGGSAAISAGLKAAFGQYQDPDKSRSDLLKDVGVGAVQGAAGGVFGALAGPAINGAMVAGNYWGAAGISAAVGAGTAVAAHLVEDIVDFADGTREFQRDIFTLENLGGYAVDGLVGGVAGMGVQGVANAFHTPAGANKLADEAALGLRQFASGASKKFLGEVVGTGIRTVASSTKTCYELKAAADERMSRGAEGAQEELYRDCPRGYWDIGKAVGSAACVGVGIGLTSGAITSLASQGGENRREGAQRREQRTEAQKQRTEADTAMHRSNQESALARLSEEPACAEVPHELYQEAKKVGFKGKVATQEERLTTLEASRNQMKPTGETESRLVASEAWKQGSDYPSYAASEHGSEATPSAVGRRSVQGETGSAVMSSEAWKQGSDYPSHAASEHGSQATSPADGRRSVQGDRITLSERFGKRHAYAVGDDVEWSEASSRRSQTRLTRQNRFAVVSEMYGFMPEEPKQILTEHTKGNRPDTKYRFVVVVRPEADHDALPELRLATFYNRGDVDGNHARMAGGDRILAAGEVRIGPGAEVKEWNLASGHYKPIIHAKMVEQVDNAFQTIGFKGARVEHFTAPPGSNANNNGTFNYGMQGGDKPGSYCDILQRETSEWKTTKVPTASLKATFTPGRAAFAPDGCVPKSTLNSAGPAVTTSTDVLPKSTLSPDAKVFTPGKQIPENVNVLQQDGSGWKLTVVSTESFSRDRATSAAAGCVPKSTLNPAALAFTPSTEASPKSTLNPDAAAFIPGRLWERPARGQ